jgi:hypothetical protein
MVSLEVHAEGRARADVSLAGGLGAAQAVGAACGTLSDAETFQAATASPF